MSRRSQMILDMMDRLPTTEWQGVLHRTWDAVLEKFPVKPDYSKTSACLYVFQVHFSGKCLHKIGVSQDVDRRLRQVVNANPFVTSSFVQEATDPVARDIANDMETELIYACREFHVRGEWFDFG